MSYATLLDQENVQESYLAVLTPRRRVTTWTVVSGFVYKASWFYNKPSSVEFDGEEMTEVASSTPGASEWYWNSSTNEIYLRTPQSADPDTGQAVALYALYVASSGMADTNFYSTPTDSSTTQVHFEPVIKQPPAIKLTTGDTLFGFYPIQSSSIQLINAEHWLEEHLYDSSFNSGSIKIYHLLGDELDTANVKLVYDGLMSDVSYTADQVSIKTLDRLDQFNQEFRNADTSFFATGDFAGVDPNQVGKPIRYVYGYVKGFKPTNIDYVQDSPTTSDNRDWVVCGEQTGLGEISRTVGSSSTSTRTYIDFVEGIQVGDTVWLDRVSGTDEYRIVTAISISPAYIEHAALSGAAMASGDAVKKGFVSRVDIVQNNVVYTAYYNRDYTIANFAVGTRGFSFTTSLEANLSLPANLSPSDTVYCTVYGRVNDLTAGGPTFGSNDPYSNNISNPVMIIYDLMKNKLGIPESSINLTQLALIRTATATEGLGIAVPASSSGSFPTYKTLITDILKSSLLRFFLDNDLKWTIEQLEPLGTSARTVDSYELSEDFKYSFQFGDVVSDVIVEYGKREEPELINGNPNQGSVVTASSDYARYTHKIVKQKTFDSLHFRSADAQVLADRLAYYLGDRKGVIEFTAPTRLYDSLINDTMTIEREKLPGFAWVEDTNRSRDFSITEVNKTIRGVKIEAEDQKGIEDNSASW